MGRRDARRAAPAAPWYARLGRLVLRWAGRCTLGAFAGTVVAGATVWAGTSWDTARWLGLGAAVVAVAATALAATVPTPPAAAPLHDDDAARTRRTGTTDAH